MQRTNTGDMPLGLGSRLDHAWRVFGTGLSFVFFGIGGFLLGFMIIPLTGLFVRNPQRRVRVARYLVSLAFKSFIEFMRVVRVLDYRIEGLDRVGDLSRCLIVANHPSLIDVVFLLAIFRRATCVVKQAHWSNPFTMGPVRLSDHISNADAESLVTEAVSRITAGGHLVMFPEGTRTVPGQEFAFHRGAATIAATAGADCLPVLIRCTPTTLTKAEPWYHVPRRRFLFEVIVLDRIPCDQIQQAGQNTRQRAINLTARLKQLYSPLQPDPRQR